MALNELEQAIQTTAIAELERNIDRSGFGTYQFDTYLRRNNSTIYDLHQKGILTDEIIDNLIERAVLDEATEYYERMTDKGMYVLYADHVLHQEFLAYALERGVVFSSAQISKIPFDHGQNMYSYIKEYREEGLLKRLREEFLHPKPLPESINETVSTCESCPPCIH